MRRGFLFSVVIALLLSSFGLADVGRHQGFAVGSVKDEAQTSDQVSFTVGMNSVAPKQRQAARAAGQAGTGLVPPAVITQVVQHQIIEQALSMCPPVQWQMPHQCQAFGLHLWPTTLGTSGFDFTVGVGFVVGTTGLVHVQDQVGTLPLAMPVPTP